MFCQRDGGSLTSANTPGTSNSARGQKLRPRLGRRQRGRGVSARDNEPDPSTRTTSMALPSSHRPRTSTTHRTHKKPRTSRRAMLARATPPQVLAHAPNPPRAPRSDPACSREMDGHAAAGGGGAPTWPPRPPAHAAGPSPLVTPAAAAVARAARPLAALAPPHRLPRVATRPPAGGTADGAHPPRPRRRRPPRLGAPPRRRPTPRRAVEKPPARGAAGRRRHAGHHHSPLAAAASAPTTPPHAAPWHRPPPLPPRCGAPLDAASAAAPTLPAARVARRHA